MATEKTALHRRIESGGAILLAEVSPPFSGDPAAVRALTGYFAGKVHALGVSDNWERVSMSALAAASLVAAEGLEAILHVVTRDRNRVALISDCLGAEALGIRNLLCTSGKHQTLGRYRAAKNVFDVDSIQLLQAYRGLRSDGALVGEDGVGGVGPFCLGAVASPYADPIEMQLMRLGKKVSAGAQFLITQPVFDLQRLETWLDEVTQRGLHEQAAIVAGIQPLCSAEDATTFARRRPDPMVPDEVLARITSAAGGPAQRAAGIEIAVETIQRLSEFSGLRGVQIRGDEDPAAAAEVIEKSGLRTD